MPGSTAKLIPLRARSQPTTDPPRREAGLGADICDETQRPLTAPAWRDYLRTVPRRLPSLVTLLLLCAHTVPARAAGPEGLPAPTAELPVRPASPAPADPAAPADPTDPTDPAPAADPADSADHPGPDGTPSLAAPARDDDLAARCPADPARVLLVGSSTMGSPLSKMLSARLTPEGHVVTRHVKASSGLARPDFFDWATELARAIARDDPDIVVIQLGSNDFQPIRFAARETALRHTLAADRPIVKRQDPAWAQVYAARVDELLAVIGPDRLVVWVGPYAFWGDNALMQGPIIDAVVPDRLGTHIARGGRGRYHSAWRETFDPRQGPLMERALPGQEKRVPIRADDRVHLNVPAVEALLRDPILAELRACREQPLENRESPASR